MESHKAVKSVENISSIEEKGLALTAVTVTTDRRNVVATQYPEAVDLGIDEKGIELLAKKYSHLKQLSADDKKAYKELTEAIKAVKLEKKTFKDNVSAEKDPINTYRAVILDGEKEGLTGIGKIEDTLKAEKQRIDDINAEKLAAQQRLWTKNLQTTMKLNQTRQGMCLEELEANLKFIESFNLDDYDFGDQIEQAKANVANAHAQVTQSIAMEKQRIKLAEDAVEQKRKAEEAETERKRLAKEANDKLISEAKASAELRNKEAAAQVEKDRIAKEEAKAKQKEIDDLKAQIAAANTPKEEEKPADEPEPKQKDGNIPARDITPEHEKRIGGHPVSAPANVINNDRGQDYQEQQQQPEQAQCGFSQEDIEGQNDKTIFPEYDVLAITSLSDELNQCAETYNNLGFQTEEAAAYVTRVTGQLTAMTKFLNDSLVEHSL